MKYLFMLLITLGWLVDLSAQTNYGVNSGTNNITRSFFGYYAGNSNTFNGFHNSFFGAFAGQNNTSGSSNSFFGYSSGNHNTTGRNNTFFGTLSGRSNTTGSDNNFFGGHSGHYNTTGSHNLFMGYMAGFDNQIGSRNVAIGAAANHNNASGNNNTMVGYHAGTLTAGSGNVFFGNKAGWYETGSNKLYIHNEATIVPLIYGDFASNGVGINTNKLSDGLTNYALSVNGKVRANKIKVYTGWADYVFEKDYQLRELSEVEAYIQQHQHLPDVPSAKQVAKEGILAGEMSATLLRKIEELTLYMIKTDQSNQKLLKHTQKLRRTYQKLQKQVKALEQKNETRKNNSK
ncbi:MAG TPA: hypothetical protein DCS93_38410 [Microscillaceae bacterium]|nr:hypothetical protein [Microscillaceae bacterium]